VFSSCPQCRHVLLVCAEVGTVFPDPHDLTQALADGARCPSCGSVPVLDSVDATSDQIKALGFTSDQYE